MLPNLEDPRLFLYRGDRCSAALVNQKSSSSQKHPLPAEVCLYSHVALAHVPKVSCQIVLHFVDAGYAGCRCFEEVDAHDVGLYDCDVGSIGRFAQIYLQSGRTAEHCLTHPATVGYLDRPDLFHRRICSDRVPTAMQGYGKLDVGYEEGEEVGVDDVDWGEVKGANVVLDGAVRDGVFDSDQAGEG